MRLAQHSMARKSCTYAMHALSSVDVFYKALIDIIYSNRNLELYRHKLAGLTCDLYALESMIFLTAGIVDSYKNPKIDLESAIVKAFSLDTLSRVVQLLLEFPASAFVIKGHQCEEYIRNITQLRFSKESAEKLKLHIGSAGLQHCHVRSKLLNLLITTNLFLFHLHLQTEYLRSSGEKLRRFTHQNVFQRKIR